MRAWSHTVKRERKRSVVDPLAKDEDEEDEEDGEDETTLDFPKEKPKEGSLSTSASAPTTEAKSTTNGTPSAIPVSVVSVSSAAAAGTGPTRSPSATNTKIPVVDKSARKLTQMPEDMIERADYLVKLYVFKNSISTIGPGSFALLFRPA